MLKFPWYLSFALPMLTVVANVPAASVEDELKEIFDAHSRYARAGELDKLSALRTSEISSAIRVHLSDVETRKQLTLTARAEAPESYKVLHMTQGKDGTSAVLYTEWNLPVMKEINRLKPLRMEMMIAYSKEQGKWKIGDITMLGDPDKINRPKDLTYDETDADMDYDSARVAGRITHVEFKDDHTLVMVRVLDDEIAVFLPEKQALVEFGVDLGVYAPWKTRVFTGYPHKTDNLRFFATGDGAME